MDKDKLIEAAKGLIEFIEENHITDEGADDGGGHYDEWCSSEFEYLINQVKEGIKAEEKKASTAKAEQCPHCDQMTFNNPCGHCGKPR